MTATSSHLSSDRVNLLDLKEWLRREFLSFFEECPGKKLIIWDKQLTQPLGLIADYKVLKERGVEKMMDLRELKDGRILKKKDLSDISHVFFIVKPKLELMSLIASNVHSVENELKNEIKEFHVLFVPRKTHLCENMLQELGVYGSFKNNLKEIFLDLIPLDHDLLSMENSQLYKDLFLHKDPTYLYNVSKSLMTMQSLYGIIPNIYGKGKNARTVANQILRMRRELTQNQEPQITPKIDNLILIDRNIDLITPMMTQLTYEGLIDENFGIKYTQLEIPQEKIKKPNQDDKLNVVEMKKSIIILNSSDSLFAEIRDRNFNAINPVLSRTAKELQQTNEEKNRLQSVSQLRMFVEKTLKTYQVKKTSLENHMTIAEIIKELTMSDEFFEKLQCQNDLLAGLSGDKPNSYIINSMSRGEDIYMVLRLICLHCAVNNGFKTSLLETYKREVIRAYGMNYFELLNNMERSNLIYTQGVKNFDLVCKKMNLLVDKVSEENPNDISYVFSGYAPLSIRFCQYLTRPNWKVYGDLFGLIPGEFFEEVQFVPVGMRKRRNSNASLNSSQSGQGLEQKMTLVFFIGGCTFAEISALRYLSSNNDSSTEFIVATTCLLNGKSFIESLKEGFI